MEEQEITYLIFFTSIIFLMLLIFLMSMIINYYRRNKKYNRNLLEIQYQKEQEILQSQIAVQESTLSSLSKDLHDNIGQLLSTAKMLLGITERSLENPPDTLKTANATVGQAINELRSLSKSLSKEWLERFDLIENLDNEVNRLNYADGVNLHLSHVEKILLKSDEQIILFRIIQEALQNSIKHASANNIYINIIAKDHTVMASIKDDGKGIEHHEKPDGVGMLNMKHRTRLLGGKIDWLSSSNGCEVLITLPIKQDEQ